MRSGRPAQPGLPPLLVVCALGIERLALCGIGGPAARRGDAAAGDVTFLRTGMGPQAAGRALARALREEREPGRTAVIATGFCAGLAPGMHPGDLVVADETRDADGVTRCTGTGVLAEALRRRGTVHTGPLAGSEHIVRGAARSALHRATGAVAVDMESAATLRTASTAAVTRPVAAVRVVVDAPGHELVRIGTLRGGISAFCVLRSVFPAFTEWHRSLLLPWR